MWRLIFQLMGSMCVLLASATVGAEDMRYPLFFLLLAIWCAVSANGYDKE